MKRLRGAPRRKRLLAPRDGDAHVRRQRPRRRNTRTYWPAQRTVSKPAAEPRFNGSIARGGESLCQRSHIKLGGWTLSARSHEQEKRRRRRERRTGRCPRQPVTGEPRRIAIEDRLDLRLLINARQRALGKDRVAVLARREMLGDARTLAILQTAVQIRRDRLEVGVLGRRLGRRRASQPQTRARPRAC